MVTKRKPTLLALLMCERIILEEDKVPSLFRVVDTFTIKGQFSGITENEVKDLEVLLQFWVFTKWGLGEGEFKEQVSVVLPGGREEKAPQSVTLRLSGFKFHQTRARFAFPVRDSGIYAIRIYLDGQLEREHPFRVNIEKAGIAPPQEGRG